MFRRISNLFRGFVSLFISGFEKRNPEALLEVEKENLRKQIANYNQGLAAHAGLCERLMAQVKKLESEEKDLKAKTSAHIRAGNRSAAGQYAIRLQTINSELQENRVQLEQAEATYNQLILARDTSIKAAQEKIQALKHSLDDLKIKRATAELSEMASGMVATIGGAGDTLNRLHEMVENERLLASGRARVAKDSLNTSDLNLQEAEQQALADQALADFAAREGIALEPKASPASPATPAPEEPGAPESSRKSMGPQPE